MTSPSSPTVHLRRRRAATAALGLAAALATACSWSVPADPGENASLRAPRGDAGLVGEAPVRAIGGDASDDGARATYVTRCSRCHEAFSPRHAPASAWPGIVRKMGPRAGLFGAERERVLRWLQANAR